MAYFNYMDEPTRVWEEPYFQDMSISQPYSNSWEDPYYALEDYEIIDNFISQPHLAN